MLNTYIGLLKLLSVTSTTDYALMKGHAEHFVAQAEYAYDASRPDELSFRSGDRLRIAPTDLQTSGSRGWLLATVDGEKSGLVPVNRIKILGRKAPNPTENEEPK